MLGSAVYHRSVPRLTTLDERDQPSIIVDPTVKAGTPVNVQRVTPTRPKVRDVGGKAEAHRSRGTWIVILIYMVSAAALGLALYERFGA
jgi:hypothetical protein